MHAQLEHLTPALRRKFLLEMIEEAFDAAVDYGFAQAQMDKRGAEEKIEKAERDFEVAADKLYKFLELSDE